MLNMCLVFTMLGSEGRMRAGDRRMSGARSGRRGAVGASAQGIGAVDLELDQRAQALVGVASEGLGLPKRQMRVGVVRRAPHGSTFRGWPRGAGRHAPPRERVYLVAENPRGSSSRRADSAEPRGGTPERGRRDRLGRAQRRAMAQALSRAVARIEASREYRRELLHLAELGVTHRKGLDPTQRERWLLLEEALLAHAMRWHEAYFRAGVAHGLEASRAGPEQSGEVREQSGEVRELVAVLKRLVVAIEQLAARAPRVAGRRA